ncbi:1-acyl-sn-glycerol-3-phosphate acyltransferase [Sphingomonas sp. F9_3S_D5_B_2]
MQRARSLLFAAIFYPMTLLWVLAGMAASVAGAAPARRVVLSWTSVFNWLARHLLGISVRVEGAVPAGSYLIAVKHQSMFETLEMVRHTQMPIIVLKRELADIPLFGWMTRRYGVIPVDREAGAKALRELVADGKAAAASGRPILIFPEGTRVRVGETPPLQSGFAALYRALGMPVVPVAVDSGRLWGRGLLKQPGVVTFRVGSTILPGLPRKEIEARVHEAINALELTSETSA